MRTFRQVGIKLEVNPQVFHLTALSVVPRLATRFFLLPPLRQVIFPGLCWRLCSLCARCWTCYTLQTSLSLPVFFSSFLFSLLPSILLSCVFISLSALNSTFKSAACRPSATQAIPHPAKSYFALRFGQTPYTAVVCWLAVANTHLVRKCLTLLSPASTGNWLKNVKTPLEPPGRKWLTWSTPWIAATLTRALCTERTPWLWHSWTHTTTTTDVGLQKAWLILLLTIENNHPNTSFSM